MATLSVQPSANRRYGGFDVLRIFAALGVVLSHSFGLTGNIATDPSLSIGHYSIDFGKLGVAIFFVTSGFLVATSWDRSQSAAVFSRSRFARIWPALITLVVVSVFILGPIMTTLSIRDYFAQGETYKYLGRNMTMFFGPAYRLPGVFAGQFGGSTPSAINGSLWTLPYELWAYVGVVVLGVVGILKRSGVVFGVLLGMLALFRFGAYGTEIPLRHAFAGLDLQLVVELGSWFLLGVAFSRVGNRLKPLPLAVGSVVAIGFAALLHEPVLFMIGLAAGVTAVGFTDFAFSDALHRLGDPSYGIYIFSFPIQQTLYKTGVAHTPWVMFAISAPLSIAAGYLSWHLVENPALRRFKRRASAPPRTGAKSHLDPAV